MHLRNKIINSDTLNFKPENKPVLIKKGCLIFSLFLAFIINSNAQSVGGITTGGATYCGSPNSGFISVSGYTGNITGWISSTNGGVSWTNIFNVTAAQSYNNLTQTTCYAAIVQNGAFPPDTSTISCVTVVPPTVPGTISGGGTFCSTSGSGTLTLSGNTGSVLSWQFSTDGGATWTNVADTNTTLNYTPITQNTLYAAVVQNSSVCSIDTSAAVSFTIVPPTVAGTISPVADTVCYLINSDTLTLAGNTGSVLSWAMSTDTGATWTLIANTTSTYVYSGLTTTTQYVAIVQNSICNIDTTNIITINVLAPVSVNAGTDVSISPGQSVNLSGTGNGTILWTPSTDLSSDTILNPVATPTVTTAYTLTITDSNSCVGSDIVIITVFTPVFNGMISSLFTPNGDGINDAWYIQDVLNYPDNEVKVYNIYGNEVYSKKGYQNDWKGTYNGTALPDGTYFYVVKMDDSGNIFQGSLDIMNRK